MIGHRPWTGEPFAFGTTDMGWREPSFCLMIGGHLLLLGLLLEKIFVTARYK